MPSPIAYPGPRPYREDESDRFFGRGYAIAEIADLWIGKRLLVLYGRPGVGKTSLLQAGVFPILQRDSAVHSVPVGRVSALPGRPLRVASGNPYLDSLLATWFPDPEFDGSSLVDGFSSVSEQVSGQQPILAAIDQFEEFFGIGTRLRGHRRRFITELARALDAVPQLRLLLSVNKDYLAETLTVEAMLNVLPRGRYRLLPLEPDEAGQALAGPWRGTPNQLDDQTIDTVVQRLQIASAVVLTGENENENDDPVDPFTLQLASLSLWGSGDDIGARHPSPHLAAFGNGLALVLNYCDEAVDAASRLTDRAPERVWEWLRQTFVTEIGTRRSVSEDELRTSDDGWFGIATALVDNDLLSLTDHNGIRYYELVHDRLIEPVRFGGRRGLTRPSRSPDALLVEADQALDEDDFLSAERQATEALTLNPADLTIRAEYEMVMGRSASRQQRHTAAAASFRSAASLFASQNQQRSVGRAQARLGRVLMEIGQIDDATEQFYSAAVKATGDQELAIDLARAFRESGDPSAAASVLSTIPDEGQLAVEALLERARIYLELKGPDAADDDLQNAISLDPTVVDRSDARELRERIRAARDTAARPLRP